MRIGSGDSACVGTIFLGCAGLAASCVALLGLGCVTLVFGCCLSNEALVESQAQTKSSSSSNKRSEFMVFGGARGFRLGAKRFELYL